MGICMDEGLICILNGYYDFKDNSFSVMNIDLCNLSDTA
jgi:hypothetical protein